MSFSPIAVELALLRQLLGPELKLTVGRELMVRVADLQPGGRGVLSLAGMLLDAKLPAGVSPGDELRLQVRELTPDRVVLAIQHATEQGQVIPTAAPLQAPVQLPGGGRLLIGEQQRQRSAAGGADTHTLVLRYDAPALGPVDMVFVLDQGTLRLALTVAPGVVNAAHDHAGELTDALTAAGGRPATVTVSPRHEPLEVYA